MVNTRIPSELHNKIIARDSLSAKEIPIAQTVILEKLMENFSLNQGERGYEMGLRTPAAFLETLTETNFKEISLDVRASLTLAADISRAIIKARYGIDWKSHIRVLAEEEVGYIGSSLLAIQTLVYCNEFSNFQPHIALVIRELATSFSKCWTTGLHREWKELMDLGRISYYSKTMIASYLRLFNP